MGESQSTIDIATLFRTAHRPCARFGASSSLPELAGWRWGWNTLVSNTSC